MSKDKRNSAIFVNGGAGRLIASIPALELFEKENPDDDFAIMCKSKYFLPSGGGFSNLIKQFVEKKGGVIF